MRRGSTQSFGSLRGRLQRSGLAALCVAPVHINNHRPTKPFRASLYIVGLASILILVLIQQATGATTPQRSAQLPGGSTDRARPPHMFATASIMVTPSNVEDLAQILMSEASPHVANDAERIAVGYTVVNRMQQTGKHAVRDVWDAYAHQASPSDDLRTLATKVLRQDVPDPTLGATHFYSPCSMPKAGEPVLGFDISGGLEQTAGLSNKNYRPGWATTYEPVVVSGVRPTHYKFYREPAVASQ